MFQVQAGRRQDHSQAVRLRGAIGGELEALIIASKDTFALFHAVPRRLEKLAWLFFCLFAKLIELAAAEGHGLFHESACSKE